MPSLSLAAHAFSQARWPLHTKVFEVWFLGRPELNYFLGVWAARAAGKNIPNGGARSAPPFGMVFPAAKVAQTSKVDDFRSAQTSCPAEYAIKLPDWEPYIFGV